MGIALVQCTYKSVYKCYFLSQPNQISQEYRPWFCLCVCHVSPSFLYAESAPLFLSRNISNKNTSLCTAGRLLIQTPDWLMNCSHVLGVFPGSLSLEGLLWPTFLFVFLKCDCIERLNKQQGAAGADAWSRDCSRDAADRLWRHPLMCDSCEWQHVLLLLPFSLMLLRSITVSMSDTLLLMRSARRFFFSLFLFSASAGRNVAAQTAR